jgi:allantoinase
VQTYRYDYSPIIGRKPLEWPNHARVALMVAPNIEFFHIDKVIPGASSPQLPDVMGYALRDYGSRIGVFRMMEVLDRHGIRATVLLNSDVCTHHPAIIDEGNKRHWEWLGHGATNNIRIPHYPPEEEHAVIRQIKESIAAGTGKAPRGWLGPGGGDESHDTLDYLAAEGFDYVCDWGCDDQPVAMRVKSGRMIALPYQQGLNDIQVMFQQGYKP